jgi:L,D-peptidoglycan transpeptidase YkuD (ErfK/YbiS/YcfS/YnhG family)
MIAYASSDGVFRLESLTFRCALGRGGVLPASEKSEGDGASPIGIWPLRRVLYRADRVSAPLTRLPVQTIGPDDGWCDDPADPAYNRPVPLPYQASAEEMHRFDHVYNIVVVLGHNDDPVVAGAGSAIFWHLARPDFAPTEGCVAVLEADMRTALKLLGPGDALEIARAEQA